MKQRFIRAILFTAAFSGLALRGYAQISPQLQALDSHFVGVWTGTNLSYRTKKKESLKLEIKENAKNGILRFDYTYGDGEKPVRFMAIDRAKSTVKLKWKGYSNDTYLADGLDRVLDTGYGTFSISNSPSDSGRKVFLRLTFELSPNSLFYFWEESLDGMNFARTGEWNLNREPSPSPSHTP